MSPTTCRFLCTQGGRDSSAALSPPRPRLRPPSIGRDGVPNPPKTRRSFQRAAAHVHRTASLSTSTNAVPYHNALHLRLPAGRHRQPQQQVSVGVCDEERQRSPSSRWDGLLCSELLSRLARYFPAVAVFTVSAESEYVPTEGADGIDPERTADLN